MTYRLRVLMDQGVPAATCAGRRPTHTHPSSVWQAAHSAPLPRPVAEPRRSRRRAFRSRLLLCYARTAADK